jgi:superfamily I DNA and RNA helicase
VYGTIVQMLESSDHWEDVGYKVNTGPLEIGQLVQVTRPDANSPISIKDVDGTKLIDHFVAKNLDVEVAWVVSEIEKFLALGLNPEDILVISLDDRNAKAYFRAVSTALAEKEISTNNVIADPFNEPPFSIQDKVTLSTVYRAKGNEASVVFGLGVEAVSPRSRGGRNKLFTAFTRTKAWLRASGIGAGATRIFDELDAALEKSPTIEFIMPDPAEIDTIQRGFSKKQEIANDAKRKFIDDLRKAGFSEEEIVDELSSGEVIE